MKTLKLLIPAIAVLALLQGCTKEYITKQYITQEYNGAQVYARDYTINPKDWKRNEGANNPGFDNYLYAEFDNPDITKDVVDNRTLADTLGEHGKIIAMVKMFFRALKLRLMYEIGAKR